MNSDKPSNVWLTKGDRFTVVSERVLRDARLNAKDLAVYQALIAHANFKTGRCFVSKLTLALWSRSSERGVYDSIKKLSELGYVRKQKTENIKVNVYYVLEPPQIPAEYDIKAKTRRQQVPVSTTSIPATGADINPMMSATGADKQYENLNNSSLSINTNTDTNVILSIDINNTNSEKSNDELSSIKNSTLNENLSLVAKKTKQHNNGIRKSTVDELLEAFKAGSGISPKTPSEKAKWMEACWELRKAGHCAKQVKVNAAALVKRFSNANMWNPMALSRWWSTLNVPLEDDDRSHIADYNAGHHKPGTAKRWHVLTDEDREFLKLQEEFVKENKPYWYKPVTVGGEK
jgi:predicted transcriptional regulator